jgi:hypothetical protein
MKDTPAQQIKVGASIHSPLETLQCIHLAFGLPTAVGQYQGGSHGIKVAQDARGQALEFSDTAALGLASASDPGPPPAAWSP